MEELRESRTACPTPSAGRGSRSRPAQWKRCSTAAHRPNETCYLLPGAASSDVETFN
jgi:hypothetical protein